MSDINCQSGKRQGKKKNHPCCKHKIQQQKEQRKSNDPLKENNNYNTFTQTNF